MRCNLDVLVCGMSVTWSIYIDDPFKLISSLKLPSTPENKSTSFLNARSRERAQKQKITVLCPFEFVSGLDIFQMLDAKIRSQ